MVSFFCLSIVMLVGVNMVFTTNDVKFNKHHLNRFSRNNDHQRPIRTILGKLFDLETNTIYNIDGQKQQGSSPMSHEPSARDIEDFACLEACFICVEDNTFAMRKKKAADNCGPKCDCANSCSRIPIEEINKTYGHDAASQGDKGCFWRTYTQVLNNNITPLQ
ncbi:unnamed protein product [Adineta ricciae]|uniref:Uncharacterized protein n=1 Tax=Adineta ricciae TaxID=249248 RepID=A0A816A0G9_ADIRI|nr:unnamed protein product [Adineta ricciae]